MASLFSAVTTNSSTTGVLIDGGEREIALSVHGTWDGATVTIEGSLDDTNYGETGSEGVFTANGTRRVWIPEGVYYLRGTISGAGGSTSVNADY